MGYCSVGRGWERYLKVGEGRGKLRCVVRGSREVSLFLSFSFSAYLPSSFEGSYGKW